MKPHIGNIYWFKTDEKSIAHPHVVIQNIQKNHITLCAITTNMKKRNWPGIVFLTKGEANLPSLSLVDVSNVYTTDTSQLGDYIGTIEKSRIDQIHAGIHLVQSYTIQKS